MKLLPDLNQTSLLLHSDRETIKAITTPPHRTPFASKPLRERIEIIERDDERLEDAWHENGTVRDDWFDEPEISRLENDEEPAE